jgi:hypothetical protein
VDIEQDVSLTPPELSLTSSNSENWSENVQAYSISGRSVRIGRIDDLPVCDDISVKTDGSRLTIRVRRTFRLCSPVTL